MPFPQKRSSGREARCLTDASRKRSTRGRDRRVTLTVYTGRETPARTRRQCSALCRTSARLARKRRPLPGCDAVCNQFISDDDRRAPWVQIKPKPFGIIIASIICTTLQESFVKFYNHTSSLLDAGEISAIKLYGLKSAERAWPKPSASAEGAVWGDCFKAEPTVDRVRTLTDQPLPWVREALAIATP